MEVTLGGDRLGAGGKQKQYLHNYERSTFNQEQDWKSSMAPGVLYPFLCIPMTNGDSMDIDLDAFVRTLPTKGPLFGSFKLQCDIFSVPMRLYNAILHNNPLSIGMKMNQVYFPKLVLEYGTRITRVSGNDNPYTWQVHPSSLLKYLGLSGIGLPYRNDYATRKINAVPVLAYYDIFKNYYANKQEENAYVITPGDIESSAVIDRVEMYNKDYESGEDIGITKYDIERWQCKIYGRGLDKEAIEISIDYENDNYSNTLDTAQDDGYIVITKETDTEFYFRFTNKIVEEEAIKFRILSEGTQKLYSANIQLSPFALSNLDTMREMILSASEIGQEFTIGSEGDWDKDSGKYGSNGLPYSTLFEVTSITEGGSEYVGVNHNSFPMNGLLLKTYQADLFQNWVDTEWIEGENGVAALSAVDVSEGTLLMDALNLAEKVYNLLNRVAISDGSWEGWQEATYTEEAVRRAETPIYEGGMSAEIMFEEVIQTSETEVQEDFAALGTLGGKGTMVGQKGGRDIHIKAREPIFVMGIASITPRICYTQGNEWYLTELNSYDDLHKPAFDGIGFQDLMLEQMAWWDTKLEFPAPGVEGVKLHRNAAGKVVAWSNYMTAVDKAYGDFATSDGKGFMVLARNYEYGNTGSINTAYVKDVTTYIDPAKFNYAFAYTKLDAQNFWVQIHSKVITRRKMSAHQIPNL